VLIFVHFTPSHLLFRGVNLRDEAWQAKVLCIFSQSRQGVPRELSHQLPRAPQVIEHVSKSIGVTVQEDSPVLVTRCRQEQWRVLAEQVS
jgi:hypothetical protein